MLKIIYLVSVSINVVWSFSMLYAEYYMASTAVFVNLMDSTTVIVPLTFLSFSLYLLTPSFVNIN